LIIARFSEKFLEYSGCITKYINKSGTDTLLFIKSFLVPDNKNQYCFI